MTCDRPRARRATLRRRTGGHAESVDEMARVESGPDGRPVFAYRIASVEAGFRYRIHAAGGLTGYYRVVAADPPRIRLARLRCEYPAYTRREAAWFDLNPDGFGRITALRGTRLTLQAGTDANVRAAELRRPQGVLAAERSKGTNGTPVWTWSVPLDEAHAGAYALRLVDEHGMTNLPFTVMFETVADETPTVERISPVADRIRARPDDRIPFAYRAADDQGIAACELEVSFDNQPPAVLPQPLPARDPLTGVWNGIGAVDLAVLGAGGRRTATVLIRVSDAVPEAMKGPQRAASKPLIIDLDGRAGDFLDGAIAAMEQGFISRLHAVIRDLRGAAGQVAAMAPALTNAGALPPPAAAQVAAARQAVAQAESGLGQLADSLAATPYARLAEAAQGIAAEQVMPVREDLEMIRLTDVPADRAEQAKRAAAGIEKSIAAAEELAKRIREQSMELAEAKRVENLAGRERDLAEKMRGLKPDQAPDQTWKNQQKQLREQLDKVLEKKLAKAEPVENKVKPADEPDKPKEKKPPLSIPFSGGGGGSGKGSGSEGTGFAIAGSAKGSPMSKEEMQKALGDLKKRTMDQLVRAESAPNAKQAGELSAEAAQFLAEIAGIMETQAGAAEGPVMAGGPSPEAGEGAEDAEAGGGEPGGEQGGGGEQAGGAGGGGGGKRADGGRYRLAKERMQALGLASEDWLRLPSELREDILQSGEGNAPEEYRQMIRNYFRDIATQGGR